MELAVSLVSDLSILIFDLALYIKLTALRKDTTLYRTIVYLGVFIITVAYVITAYVFHVPYGVASFICMTIPSFLLFFCLSKYKNARFLVTFCFVDTVTLILAAMGKVAMILGGNLGGILSCLVLIVLCTATYLALRPYFSKYRTLMEQVDKGWGPMAVSTVLIYLLLIFFTAYPTALIKRLEYLPLYLLLCVTILSFYVVFILLLLQKSKLMEANLLLQKQQHWHDLAYLDELTQLANSAAYAARTAEIEQLEQETPRGTPCAVMIFDLDEFKKVNDTYGHLYGNEVLKKAADFFKKTFPREHYEFFRVGGDEFAAISTGIPEEQISEKVAWINAMPVGPELGCTYSCGYAMVDFDPELKSAAADPSEYSAFRLAFQKADEAMYTAKKAKKRKRGSTRS